MHPVDVDQTFSGYIKYSNLHWTKVNTAIVNAEYAKKRRLSFDIEELLSFSCDISSLNLRSMTNFSAKLDQS